VAMLEKIAHNEKYGIHYFNVHKIGKDNVKNIREAQRALTKSIEEKVRVQQGGSLNSPFDCLPYK